MPEAQLSNFRGTELTATGRQAPDQLVVGLQHLREVRYVLKERLGTEVTHPPSESPELGLALLTLPDLSQVAGAVRGRLSALAEKLRERPADRTGPGAKLLKAIDTQLDVSRPPNVDLLLTALRAWFVDEYEGWMPTLGKNRLIRGIEGLPEIGGGLVGQGKGDPHPLPQRAVFELPPVAADVRRRIRVGVLDTPIFAHPALAGRYVVAGPDAYLPDEILDAARVPRRAGHGTFVAGLILQQAPDAELEIRSALDPAAATAYIWDVATKMVQFRGSVDILNMSFGCATDDGEPPLLLSRAVEQLSPEMVLIAAAGNHGDVNEPVHAGQELPELNPKTPYWPAAFQDVWAVGALDQDGERAKFSPDLPWVEFTALGVDVASTYLPGQVEIPRRKPDGTFTDSETEDFGAGYAVWSGTSVAAATRSGDLAAWAQRESRTAREMVEFLLQRSLTGPGGDSRPFHN